MYDPVLLIQPRVHFSLINSYPNQKDQDVKKQQVKLVASARSHYKSNIFTQFEYFLIKLYGQP